MRRLARLLRSVATAVGRVVAAAWDDCVASAHQLAQPSSPSSETAAAQEEAEAWAFEEWLPAHRRVP